MNEEYIKYQKACDELRNTYRQVSGALVDLSHALSDMGNAIDEMNKNASQIDWESVEEELKVGVDRKGDN